MTIDELLSLAGLTANDEIPVWDAEAVDEPTKKITAQNLAASVKALAVLVGEAEFTEQLADKADVIVDTASGAIASFPDGAAVAAKDITIGIEPVQSGSGDPSPTNVRPISGWTGANVTRTGKNLIPMTVAGVKAENTAGTWSGDSYTHNGITWTILTDSNENITGIKANGTTSGANSIFALNTYFIVPKSVAGYISGSTTNVKNRTWLSNWNGGPESIGGEDKAMTTPSDGVLRCRLQVDANKTVSNEIVYPMIRLASNTDPTFAPYIDTTTIPISWQASAGTVYGGTLDVTTGLLTVDRASFDLSELTFTYNSADTRWVSNNMSSIKIGDANDSSPLFEKYKTVTINQQNSSGYQNIICGCTYGQKLYIRTLDSSTQPSGNVVLLLRESVSYTLTADQVTTLLGVNNIWADCGPSTVEYLCDTKLYIQKINAPTDDDMIADAQIASGKYFIIGGNLYRSTTTIPAGDAINPGTNCILTNLADALNALNT